MKIWIALSLSALALGGCARTTSRLEVLGCIEPVAPCPPLGMGIMEIPIQKGDVLPPDAPIVMRDGKKYLLVAVDRAEVWRNQRGLILPERIWTGRPRDQQTPVIGASIQIAHLQDELKLLKAQLDHEKKMGSTVTSVHADQTLASLHAQIAHIGSALRSFETANRVEIPSHHNPGSRIRAALDPAVSDLAKITLKINVMREIAPVDPSWENETHDIAEQPRIHPDVVPLLDSLDFQVRKIQGALDDGRVDLVTLYTKKLYILARDTSSEKAWVEKISSSLLGETQESRNRRWTMQRLLMGVRVDAGSALGHITHYVTKTTSDDPTHDVMIIPDR